MAEADIHLGADAQASAGDARLTIASYGVHGAIHPFNSLLLFAIGDYQNVTSLENAELAVWSDRDLSTPLFTCHSTAEQRFWETGLTHEQRKRIAAHEARALFSERPPVTQDDKFIAIAHGSVFKFSHTLTEDPRGEVVRLESLEATEHVERFYIQSICKTPGLLKAINWRGIEGAIAEQLRSPPHHIRIYPPWKVADLKGRFQFQDAYEALRGLTASFRRLFDDLAPNLSLRGEFLNLFCSVRFMPGPDYLRAGMYDYSFFLLFTERQKEILWKTLGEDGFNEIAQPCSELARGHVDVPMNTGIASFDEQSIFLDTSMCIDAPDVVATWEQNAGGQVDINRRKRLVQILTLYGADKNRRLAVPIHVGGLPWMALSTSVAPGDWETGLIFYEKIAQQFAPSLRALVAVAYGAHLVEVFRKSLDERVSVSAFIATVNRLWAQAGLVYPHPVPQLWDHEPSLEEIHNDRGGSGAACPSDEERVIERIPYPFGGEPDLWLVLDRRRRFFAPQLEADRFHIDRVAKDCRDASSRAQAERAQLRHKAFLTFGHHIAKLCEEADLEALIPHPDPRVRLSAARLRHVWGVGEGVRAVQRAAQGKGMPEVWPKGMASAMPKAEQVEDAVSRLVACCIAPAFRDTKTAPEDVPRQVGLPDKSMLLGPDKWIPERFRNKPVANALRYYFMLEQTEPVLPISNTKARITIRSSHEDRSVAVCDYYAEFLNSEEQPVLPPLVRTSSAQVAATATLATGLAEISRNACAHILPSLYGDDVEGDVLAIEILHSQRGSISIRISNRLLDAKDEPEPRTMALVQELEQYGLAFYGDRIVETVLEATGGDGWCRATWTYHYAKMYDAMKKAVVRNGYA